MISELSASLSNAIFLSVITVMSIALYVVFAYLVAHSKIVDTRRRWRYSILWGVSIGVINFILLGFVFVLGLFTDINQSGFAMLLNNPMRTSDLFISIILVLMNPILISVLIVFIFTFGTYINELRFSDLHVTHLLYPIKKHPSDQSPDDIFTQVRNFVANLIDR